MIVEVYNDTVIMLLFKDADWFALWVEVVRVIVCCVHGRLVSDAMGRLYISKSYFVRVVESRGVSLYVSYEFKVLVL
jgi:hypothetical protein